MVTVSETRGELVAQFASTFREWHYLVGGACAGFVAGFLFGHYIQHGDGQ